ncbi:MAG: DUF1295 domain-containing protein [Thiobacillus sp.]
MDGLVLLLKTWSLGLSVLLTLQYFVFLYAYRKKRIDAVDIFWGPSIIAVSFAFVFMNISSINIATLVALGCIDIWGLRLFSHIFVSYKSRNFQDQRYTEITKSFIHKPFIVYIKIFAIQALLASLVAVVFLAAAQSNNYNPSLLIMGLLLWLFGFIFESFADFQLRKHIENHPGELMKGGLWKYSRHPNYFGELVQWWAIWLMLSGGEFAMLGLVGPLSISILIIFISGIPPLERHMVGKKGWEDYKKSTSMILPMRNYK